jgi:hypothetical protein
MHNMAALRLPHLAVSQLQQALEAGHYLSSKFAHRRRHSTACSIHDRCGSFCPKLVPPCCSPAAAGSCSGMICTAIFHTGVITARPAAITTVVAVSALSLPHVAVPQLQQALDGVIVHHCQTLTAVCKQRTNSQSCPFASAPHLAVSQLQQALDAINYDGITVHHWCQLSA